MSQTREPCPICDGSGRVFDFNSWDPDGDGNTFHRCPTCKGSGVKDNIKELFRLRKVMETAISFTKEAIQAADISHHFAGTNAERLAQVLLKLDVVLKYLEDK